MQTPEVADQIISICQAANVQLMDGTMWSHNDRAQRMEEAIAARLDPCGMGPLKAVTCTFCCAGGPCNSSHLGMSPGQTGAAAVAMPTETICVVLPQEMLTFSPMTSA